MNFSILCLYTSMTGTSKLPPKKTINSYVQFIRMLGVDDPFLFGVVKGLFFRGVMICYRTL